MNAREVASELYYILGRLEGLSEGIEPGPLRCSLYNTADKINDLIIDIDTEVKPEL